MITYTPKITLILIFFINSVFGQSLFRPDSLLQLAKFEENDSIKLERYIDLGNRYKSISYDSCITYYKTALDLSTKNSNRTFNLLSAKANRLMAEEMFNNGKYELAVVTYKKALEVYKKQKLIKKEADSYNFIGVVYDRTGNYPSALENYHKALKISESIQDTFNIATTYNNIGSVHFHLDDNKKAIKYYNYSIEAHKKLKYNIGIAASYVNIGLIYNDNKEFDKALFSYREALNIYKKAGVEVNMAGCYVNMGITSRMQGDLIQAVIYYNKALEYAHKLDNKYHLTILYGNIAFLNITLKKYNAALLNANKSLKYAEELNSLEDKKYAYKYISRAYQGKGQYKSALKYHKLFGQVKDSIIDANKTQILAEMETRFQTTKQEQQILLQETEIKMNKEQIAREQAENKIQEADAKQKALERNYLLIGFVLMILLVFVVFKSFKEKKKANELLTEQKDDILEKNEELNQQNEEIVAQRDEIENHKKILEHKNEQITDSIDYATRLQQSILPEEKVLKKFFSDHFVFLKPKDKVSGDFYWWAHVENHIVLTAADCTGHGVPGAFMSMLGVSFLREIVIKEYITHTGVILRKLRKEVVKALKQTGESGTHKDGMDMALISINLENKLMQFSGANNPLYILRKEKIKTENPAFKSYESSIESAFNLYEIKPDKMPIAIYDKMDKFTTHEIQLLEEDQIYLFSDGFVDQFGGVKGKKYKSKSFKNLLLQNADKTMKQQQIILKETFNNWKGNLEQVDDVVVVGIQI